MSQSADAAIKRWSDIVHGRTTKGPLTASNIMVRGDIIYSYGPHFELARPLRNKKGEVVCFLLNGDSYSVTTSGHQSSVRYAVGHDDHVIIPHSALTQAGVDLDSIQILDRLEDRYEHTQHHSDTMPESAQWHVRDDMRTVDKTDDEVQAILDAMHAESMRSWEDRRKWAAEEEARGEADGFWSRAILRNPDPPERPARKVLSFWQLRKDVKVGEIRTLHTSGNKYAQEITITTLPDGSKSYDWETSRHWLGESLIRAKVQWWITVTCPWCDGSGWAIGPSQSVHWGRPQCPDCRGRGSTIHEHHRWATFLSGFDHQEARPLYFFCELPYRSTACTVREAYEALKPDPVKLAEQMGRDITRQGDIFAVPTRMDRKALKAQGARLEKRWVPAEAGPVHLPYILGTNHTATEVAYLPGGLTLARGVLYHDPSGRRRDHARRRLGDGKTWHIVVKNTVPTSGRR